MTTYTPSTKSTTSYTPVSKSLQSYAVSALLLESGDVALLENGDNYLIELLALVSTQYTPATKNTTTYTALTKN